MTKKIVVFKFKHLRKQTIIKIPFCVNACVIFLPKEPHSVESSPWLGHKIFQLSLQLYSAQNKKQVHVCDVFSFHSTLLTFLFLFNPSTLNTKHCGMMNCKTQEERKNGDVYYTFPPPLGPTRATFDPGCSFNVMP